MIEKIRDVCVECGKVCVATTMDEPDDSIYNERHLVSDCCHSEIVDCGVDCTHCGEKMEFIDGAWFCFLCSSGRLGE